MNESPLRSWTERVPRAEKLARLRRRVLTDGMASYDFSAPRLHVDAALATDVVLALDRTQQNYCCNVLRLSDGDTVLVFNGRDGEFAARLARAGRRDATLTLGPRAREQTMPGDLLYLFAPLKHARLDYMVQKAVEMGASHLCPVATRRTQAARVNIDRMRANAIEAAEQCGILTVPDVGTLAPLADILATWSADRILVFCDEDAASTVGPLAALAGRSGPLAVLIGPEGGFDPDERAAILRLPSVVRLGLGPRILRADTAAVAALALVQASIGDWRARG